MQRIFAEVWWVKFWLILLLGIFCIPPWYASRQRYPQNAQDKSGSLKATTTQTGPDYFGIIISFWENIHKKCWSKPNKQPLLWVSDPFQSHFFMYLKALDHETNGITSFVHIVIGVANWLFLTMPTGHGSSPYWSPWSAVFMAQLWCRPKHSLIDSATAMMDDVIVTGLAYRCQPIDVSTCHHRSAGVPATMDCYLCPQQLNHNKHLVGEVWTKFSRIYIAVSS